MMHIRAALLSVALLALPLIQLGVPASAAQSLAEAARLLNGEWHGESFVLRIDADRAQASFAPERPFEWQRFIVKAYGEEEIVFSIGAELFQATVGEDTLTLTGTSFRGARVLFRNTDLRGTTNE